MEIWKGLAQLFPAARPFIDYEIRDDGDGAYIASWHLPDPQPTEEQLTAAIAAFDAAAATAQTEANALRTRVVNLAQSAVGVQIDALTAGQVRALVTILLWKAGAVDKTGAIKPLNTWVR